MSEVLDEEQDVTSVSKPARASNGQLLPGNTANPLGRPKGSFSLVEMIKNKLQETPEGKDKTYAEYFIEKLMSKAVIEGDAAMMRDMINRVDGMAKQHTDVTTNGKDMPTPILPLGTIDK